jgi:translocation and assembly module TamB
MARRLSVWAKAAATGAFFVAAAAAGIAAHLDTPAVRRLIAASHRTRVRAGGNTLGAQVGTLDGHFDVAADRNADGRTFDVTVDVPSAHVQLPLSAAHEVEALGELPGVHVGTLRGRSGFVAEAMDSADGPVSQPVAAPATPLRVTVNLGRDVEVKRGMDMDVVLAGRPTIALSDDIRATGQIRLVRGTIDVQGKRFTLDDGTVTFVGDDPTNPQVVLTAEWPAPDGTIVYADFIGPLKSGRVNLRSDPARSKNEILALLLFGTTDGLGSTQTSSDAQKGAGVVGGAAGAVATQPVNRVLDGFGLAGGISTKIDTSTSTPRPEVELQIARDISLQVAWVLGAPTPGTNPDTTLVHTQLALPAKVVARDDLRQHGDVDPRPRMAAPLLKA